MPSTLTLGRTLLYTSLTALGVGGLIVNVFFPHMKGQGLDTAALSILIPIWLIGIVGILLLLASWIADPYQSVNLNEMEYYARRPDGRMFGPLVRVLICFTMALFWLAMLLAATSLEEPYWQRCLVAYCASAYCAFSIYMAAGYSRFKHWPTTTYLYHFGPLFAWLLVPLTLPFLVAFNSAWTFRQRRFEHFDANDEFR